MSQNLETRIHGLQPQLPLLAVDADESTPVKEAPVDEDRDWHLDEQTRQVGRRGIAAARAHLRSAAGRAA